MVFTLFSGFTAIVVALLTVAEDLLAATEMEVPLDEDAVDGSVLTVSAIILLLLFTALLLLWPVLP